jgi:hypothetical protein
MLEESMTETVVVQGEDIDAGDVEIINQQAQEEGWEDPYVNSTHTYIVQEDGERLEDFPTGDYQWVWEYDDEATKDSEEIGEILGSPAQTDYAWESTGLKTITVTITHKGSDEDILIKTEQWNVVEPDDGGGGILSRSDTVPSMDQAADSKNRGGF